jgi:hypothetical protein
MNVSITEDATISRTRLEGGATVVREDPIAINAGENPAAYHPLGGPYFTERPAMSLFLKRWSVNKIDFWKSHLSKAALFPAEEFFRIFEKTDQDYHRRPRHSGEEEYLEKADKEDRHFHSPIISRPTLRKYKDDVDAPRMDRRSPGGML